MLTVAVVGLGGALGSMARYCTGLLAVRLLGEAFPWGTLVVNVIGSFVIGGFATLTLPGGPLPASMPVRAFVMAGLCGGYTTLSAFSLQTWDLMRAGNWFAAAGNVVASVLLSLLAVMGGHLLAMRVGLR